MESHEQKPSAPSTTMVKTPLAAFGWCSGRVKQEIAEIVGKKIVGVVVKENNRSNPPRQVFLIFDDGTNFEFYADCELSWTTGVHPGGVEWVRNYGAATHKIRLEYLEPNQHSINLFKKLLSAVGTAWNLRRTKRNRSVL